MVRQTPAPHSPASRHHHVKVVITGSVNSSELTLFDPVIHAWRPALHVDGRVAVCPPAGEAGPMGPAMTQSFYAAAAPHSLTRPP